MERRMAEEPMVGRAAGQGPHPPSLADAVAAVAALIVLIAASFLLFGDVAAFGPTQVALTLCATLAAGIAWKNGHSWDDIRAAAVEGIASALPAIFILFAVGALIGPEPERHRDHIAAALPL